MFWLHGGGFQFGSASQPFYDVENLVRRGPTKDLPQWSPYSADDRATMIFDHNPRIENDPARELRTFWQEEEQRQGSGRTR
jgi:carboxylesterase type B